MLAQGKLLRDILVVNMDRQLEEISQMRFQKELCMLENEEAYVVVLCLVKRLVDSFVDAVGEKKMYYISPGFEKRKFLKNNLKNLGIYELLESILSTKGQNIDKIELAEQEYLGTQNLYGKGVGEFLEAMAQSHLPGEAIGIRRIRRYEDRGTAVIAWESDKSWLEKEDTGFQLEFNHRKAQSILYSIDVAGNNKEIYKYRIFDLEIEDYENMEEQQVCVEYFLISSAVRLILKQMRENQYDLRKLFQYADIKGDGQYHALIIPEMIRIFMEEKAIPWKESVQIVKKTCGYVEYEDMITEIKKCPEKYVDALVPGLIEKLEKLILGEKENAK